MLMVLDIKIDGNEMVPKVIKANRHESNRILGYPQGVYGNEKSKSSDKVIMNPDLLQSQFTPLCPGLIISVAFPLKWAPVCKINFRANLGSNSGEWS